MTGIAVSLAVFAAACAVWSYLVYPRLVQALAGGFEDTGIAGEGPLESVEVLVSAADEESVIGQRAANLLAQDFTGEYSVAVGCDGSSDRTGSIARERLGGRGRVVEFPARRGKASVLNDLIATSSAQILVFTDANTAFEPDAVTRLVRAFRNERVGAVCGRLRLEGSDAESVFWERETRLKEAEGKLGVCLGANGAIYAARRREIAPLAPDTTSMDDFLIPLSAARRGRAIVFAADAVAREPAARDPRAEMNRRFRIGIGAGQVLRRELWLWNIPAHPRLSLAFFSRKVARWLAPLAALAACVAACGSRPLAPAGAGLLAGAIVLALSARAGPRPSGLAGRLYYFGVINLALAAGVLAGSLGYSRPVWKPVAR